MIRKARTEDRYAIAELCYIIWKDMELDMVAQVEKSRLLEVFADSVTKIRYRGHKDHIWVYEYEGNVAGILIAYPGQYEMAFERTWQELDLPEDIAAFGTPLPTKEAEDDEYYIETVATFPQYRGKGIATQLFEHVMASDTSALWSLNCDVANPRAYALYQRLGFETVSMKTLYGHEYYHMVKR